MKADGSVIIDTKIIDGGLKKGFDLLKNQMSSVGVGVEELGNKLKITFSDKATVAIENAVIKVKRLEQKLDNVTEELSMAKLNGDDSGVEKWYNRQKSVYDRLYDARRRLASVIVKEAQREANAETKAARKAATEKNIAYAKATKGAKSFGKRIASIAASALLFNVVSKGLRSVTEYFGKALKTNKQFNETASNLKGALLTAFQPLYETLLPGIITAMQILTKYALTIGNFFASITGKNANQLKKNAEALYDQANATEENAKAAKKASKALAGFDEINTMQNKGESDSSSSSANFNLDSIDLNSKLGEMVAYTSAAILAIGLILALSGVNIPLGIGMIALGAIGLYQSIKQNWGAIKDNVLTTSDAIAFLGGTLLLAIGIIIAYCCPTYLALGIGMIIGGASLIATTVALNWNAIKDTLQNSLVATVAVISGAVLVVLGILCCFAQVWALGIGLIVAGAALIVTTVAVNWNAIVDAMQGPIGELVAIVSGALLIIGIILLCCGVITPLTIGLVVAGATGLATSIAFNWNAIVDWVKNVWNKVKEFWNKYIAPVFTGKFWLDLAKGCGNGLIAGFEGAINGIIWMFESMINWVVKGLNKIKFDVPDWVPGIGGSKFGFNIPEVKFNRVSIPRLAQGAVIPPNREFLAVLGDQKRGTNIEAPLETIKQALTEVLALQGAGETNVNVTFTGDLAQLARVLKPAIETETRRKGGSLASGGSY